MNSRTVRRGLNLIELVLVVVIFGLLAAIAIPRLSSGAPSQPADLLQRDLAILRSAVELYYLDHGAYPGQKGHDSAGRGAGTEAAVVLQLTRPTDAEGRVVDPAGEAPSFGPYLRDGIPPCPVGPRRGRTGIHVISGAAVPAYRPSATRAGWVYNCTTGEVAVNSPARDARGVRYDAY